VIERYKDIDIPVTFGILIADYDQQPAREYIINYLDVFDNKSSKYIDFFIPGYTEQNYRNDMRPIHFKRKFYFSRSIFLEFIEQLEKHFEINCSYNPMLILMELHNNDIINTKKVIIDLDSDTHNVKRTGQLFENIFKIAKKNVDLKSFSHGLAATYVKGEFLDAFLRVLDNRFITEIATQHKNVKQYKIV